ncbi:MAG: N-acetyltransferase [Candidatus Peregrinibacteria bacterium]|nr:N-acetyltransferase [Candidatus Peregrinibacteria bacterium]
MKLFFRLASKHMPNFTLQKATIANWETIEQIEKTSNRKLYAPRIDKAEILHDITNNFIYFIVVENKKIGFISYIVEADGNIEFNGLVILPEFQGQGIAKATFEQVLEMTNAKHYSLFVHPENEAALKIYTDAGFTIQSRLENHFGDGEPRLFMTLAHTLA